MSVGRKDERRPRGGKMDPAPATDTEVLVTTSLPLPTCSWGSGLEIFRARWSVQRDRSGGRGPATGAVESGRPMAFPRTGGCTGTREGHETLPGRAVGGALWFEGDSKEGGTTNRPAREKGCRVPTPAG